MTNWHPQIAVFGCGGWGKNIVRSLNALGALRAVVDPSESGRAQAGKLAPDASVHASPEAVLEDPEVTGVMIATPAETHYEMAIAALDAGKDVFVEKPLTVDVEEGPGSGLARADELGSRVLMVGHLLEYHPAILKLKEMVQAGELGQASATSCRTG